MKIVKYFIIDAVALYLISMAVQGMTFDNGVKTLLLTGVVLSLSQMIVRPLINLLLLPINLITFGLFKWVGYAITLYLVTLIVPGFAIGGFYFPGVETYWFNFPTISLTGTLAFIAFSFVISSVSSIMFWLMK
ncbi:MAG: phage holin family protein [Microgenomates group bacterium]